MHDLNKFIYWKLTGLFVAKFFLYLLVIPVCAMVFYDFALRLALPFIFGTNTIGGPSGIGFRMWWSMALAIYNSTFYLFAFIFRFVSSKNLRFWILWISVLLPAIYVGVQFKAVLIWSLVGNLLYNGSYYMFYFILDQFMPSFRIKIKDLKQNL